MSFNALNGSRPHHIPLNVLGWVTGARHLDILGWDQLGHHGIYHLAGCETELRNFISLDLFILP